MATVREI